MFLGGCPTASTASQVCRVIGQWRICTYRCRRLQTGLDALACCMISAMGKVVISCTYNLRFRQCPTPLLLSKTSQRWSGETSCWQHGMRSTCVLLIFAICMISSPFARGIVEKRPVTPLVIGRSSSVSGKHFDTRNTIRSGDAAPVSRRRDAEKGWPEGGHWRAIWSLARLSRLRFFYASGRGVTLYMQRVLTAIWRGLWCSRWNLNRRSLSLSPVVLRYIVDRQHRSFSIIRLK